jgi:chromosomal replication initiation ATPase DnaA
MKKDIFDIYATTIAKKFHLSLDEMFTKTRRRDIVDARQLLYYLCMERPMRVSYIKRFMEENGHQVTHSNIIYSYRKAKELVDSDSDFKGMINDILGQ